MAGVQRSARARWSGSIGNGKGLISASSGAFADLGYTFASRTAPTSAHTDPEELLAAAHAGCFAMALASELDQASITPEQLDVAATVTLAPTSRGRRITRSELTVRGAFATPADERRFSEIVGKADIRCPFSALIRAEGEVVVHTASAT